MVVQFKSRVESAGDWLHECCAQLQTRKKPVTHRQAVDVFRHPVWNQVHVQPLQGVAGVARVCLVVQTDKIRVVFEVYIDDTGAFFVHVAAFGSKAYVELGSTFQSSTSFWSAVAVTAFGVLLPDDAGYTDASCADTQDTEDPVFADEVALIKFSMPVDLDLSV